MPPESIELYKKIGRFLKQKKLDSKLCDSLVKLDRPKEAYLSADEIKRAFKQHEITISRKQLELLTKVLPFDVDDRYNYLTMIELLLGREYMLSVKKEHQIVPYWSQHAMQEKKIDVNQLRL